ncbi:hypothetical protein ACN28S_42735 [Cystobacter fuscus]
MRPGGGFPGENPVDSLAQVEQAESLTEPSEANAIRFLEQATFGPRRRME